MLFPFPQPASSPSRVVITGIGVITALGTNYRANEEGFRSGRQAFREVSLFDVSRQRVRRAAEVLLPDRIPTGKLAARQKSRLDRSSQLLLMAGFEAYEQAGWQASENRPLVLGTTSGGMSLGEAFYRQAIAAPPSQRGQPRRVLHYQAQRQALDLTEALGFRGPITIIANACASGANAIGHAFELIQRGHAREVLTGGYDGLSQLVFAGFDSLQALSTTQCRPFDQNRDGLALGEGAAVLALESLESARKRNAEILGEIVGYGTTTDVHHLTQPQPQGEAALGSMRAACRCAGIHPSQIGYVNAHGTGTPLNDSAEAEAINRWAGDHAANVRVSSTKSSIGHLLGAAGAVEAAVCLMALRGQWFPPTITTRNPDAACHFSLVNEAEDGSFDYALTNSFGFGGANASLILRRWS